MKGNVFGDNAQDIAISAIGPIQDLPDYNKFRRRTYFNRY